LFLVSPAVAQEAAADGTARTETSPQTGDAVQAGEPGDIIVTAQKRSERVQDVAASIAVVTGDSLQKSGAVNYADYLNSIPSVSYAKNSGFKDKIFIRGLSDTMGSRVLSTTGIYIDETPITEVDASLGDLGTFDMNRIEVLRGPQGTLFGSGSMGGTVRVITNKPDLDKVVGLVSGQLSGTSHGGANYDLNAMLNLPVLTDKVGLRLVGGYRDDSGFITNLVDGKDDINSSHSAYVRGLLSLKPTDNLDILLAVHYQHSKAYFGPNQDVGRAPYTAKRFYPEVNEFTTRIYNATINYTLPFATITSATSYINKTNFSARDFTSAYLAKYQAATGIAVPNQGVSLNYDFPNKGLTQELRIASSSKGPLHWLVGGYYNDFGPYTKQTYSTTIPSLSGFNYSTSMSRIYRRELAGFGEASVDVTDKFQLTAGVRHSTFWIGKQGNNSGYTYGGTITLPWVRIEQQATVLKFRADYKITPDNMIYAVASQGYRPGGIVSSFDKSCLPQLQQLGYSTPPAQYDPDRLWNFEVGSKNQFLDRRLTVNADAYYIKWRNTQVAQNLQCGNQFISNAGGATSKGIELEVQAHPTDSIDLALGGGYTDATFTRTDPTIQVRKGADLPNVPKWTFSSSAQYNWTMGDAWKGFAHADLQYVDGRYSDLPLASSNVFEKSYTTINARLGVIHGPWQVDLFARNLTNEVAILNTSNTSGMNYQTINQPRTIGMAVRRSF